MSVQRVVLLMLVTAPVTLVAATPDFADMQGQMIKAIEADMRSVGRTLEPAVREALVSVKRHEFVPDELDYLAYRNHPLPIGDEQTISQPFIVALMTQLLDLSDCSRVLEVGTGSAYQAAVLAELCGDVYTVEIIGNLARSATLTLQRLGYDNVHVRHGDGMLGWPDEAPFDAIIVTAAGIKIPVTLLEQLRDGGKLVMPVGPQNAVQHLKVIERVPGGFHEESVLPVRFVPVTDRIR